METRAERLKRRYNYLMNYFEDSKKANMLKHWGEERLYKEYGLRIPQTTSRRVVQEVSKKKRQQRAKKQTTNFRALKQAGFSADKAKSLKKKSKRMVEFYITGNPMHYFERKTTLKEAQQRKSLWAQWSKDTWKKRKEYEAKGIKDKSPSMFPDWVDEMAETFNEQNKLQDEDSYGYAVLYESFHRGDNPEIWMKQLEPDEYDGNRYVRNLKEIKRPAKQNRFR